MHRKEQFEELVNEWVELELPSTCTSLDLYTSMEIKRSLPNSTGGTVVFTKKCKGVHTEEARVYLDSDNKMSGLVMSASTPVFGLMIYALEKAIETN